jgi:hypothetical protein
VGSVEGAMAEISKKLFKSGKERFFKNLDIDLSDYDLEFNASNETIDKNLLVQDLINMMKIAPQYQEPLIEQVLDVLGIKVRLPQQQQQGQVPPGQVPQEALQEAQSCDLL